MGSPRRIGAIISAAALALALALTSAASGSVHAVAYAPSPSSTYNSLYDVYARSSADAWAVGTYADQTDAYETLTLHWNGTRWSRVWSPSPSTFATLRGVSGTSASDIWAVGYRTSTTGPSYRTLILRWRRTGWSRVPSPDPGSGMNLLTDVVAISPTNAWAVGISADDGGYRSLTLHWNGTRWTRVPSPNGWCASCGPLAQDTELNAVGATSATDVWAGGTFKRYPDDGKTDTNQTFVLRWRGTRWSKVTAPDGDIVMSISGRSPSDVWMAGYTPLLHWNGTGWSQTNGVPSLGIVEISPTDVWTTGGRSVSHFDGTTWSVVWTWSDPGYAPSLDSIAATSSTDVWVVGDSYAYATGVRTTMIMHWDGGAWHRT